MPRRYQGPRFGGQDGVQFIIVGAASYGSAEVEALDRLRAVLSWVAGRQETRQVQVDLSEPPTYGARLLGLLVELANQLDDRDTRLIVTGDHLGLLTLTALSRRIECRQG